MAVCTSREKTLYRISYGLIFVYDIYTLAFDMSSNHEYEVTCGIVFDGEIYHKFKSILFEKCKKPPIEETIDIYAIPKKDGERYRALTRYGDGACCSIDDTELDYRKFDHKKTSYVYESQIPYVECENGRVLFITCTYKESVEVILNEDEWKRTVKEDHTSGHCMRVHNKKRICFYKDAFDTNMRVSIGKQSSYGGTLEARSTCNSIYYFEIELESDRRLGSTEINRDMRRVCKMLFQLLPYELVKAAMLAKNTCSVQRERIDGVFDTFKRQFRDYKSCALDLQQRECLNGQVDFFIMPKWDGIRAVGLYYCDGYLIVKDACGRISSFCTTLPFDNDMIIQLEAVRPKRTNMESGSDYDVGTDSEGYYYVVTELLAVLIKSPNTLYHVYGRNNVMYDTGRNIGNVVTSIAIKTQFENASHVCSLYRPLTPDTSLRIFSMLSKIKNAKADGSNDQCRHIVTLTSVVNTTAGLMSVKDMLDYMDDASTSDTVLGQRTKQEIISLFIQLFPKYLQNDSRFQQDCEGLIVAFTKQGNAEKRFAEQEEYGYFKLKTIDTIDLELNLITGTLTSVDLTQYCAEGLPTLDTVRNWAERPSPIKNQRIIVECYYDGTKLVFLKDRCDKSRPDSDSKIKATNYLIFDHCKACI